MKLVITSQGPNLADPVDPRFGRARYHILFDPDDGEFTALDNDQRVEAAQGAGVQAAQNVVARGAGVLLTGHCGPKAYEVLCAAGVQVYSGIEGTVLEAVQAWRQGNLELLAGPADHPSRH
jgi:predicted Fe-Mo cluster-binding NifX family protein